MLPSAKLLYLPTWTKDEFLEAADVLKIQQAAINERFPLCGGSARECFRNEDIEALTRRMRDAAKACDAKALLAFVSDEEVFLSAYTNVNKVALLVHILVDDTCTAATSYCFASPYAAELVAQKLLRDLQQDTRTLIAQLVENKIEGTFAGVATEHLLHRDLADGCRVVIVDLCSGEEMHVEIPKSSAHYFQRIEDIADDARQSTYWMPRSSNEPAIDAVISPRVCLQMTIAKRHALGQVAMTRVTRHLLKVRLGARLNNS